MRALIQRVSRAKVSIEGKVVGEIGTGLLIFVGIGQADSESECTKMAEKISKMRIFEDSDGKMNMDVIQRGACALIVSQFTLYADTRKGNRPSFVAAARPEEAIRLYRYFVDQIKSILGENKVAEGVFGAMMDVELINEGPVTIWVD